MDKVNPKDYFSTLIDEVAVDTGGTFEDGVNHYVKQQLASFSQARLEKEETWLECWSMYLGTPEARRHLKTRVFKSLGNVNSSWRHDITTGKAFEQVETVVAYLMQAFFPNRDWFDVRPMAAGHMDLVKPVKEYTRTKFYECKFTSYWEMFIRQMTIVGSSVIALPWRVETVQWKKKVKVNRPKYKKTHYANYDEGLTFKEVKENRIVYNAPAFEVLDMFDCYLDPRAIDIS
ncbi:MAG: hypothetical protein ACRDEA_04800, partial [Microcystaceae cyanobacterium]